MLSGGVDSAGLNPCCERTDYVPECVGIGPGRDVAMGNRMTALAIRAALALGLVVAVLAFAAPAHAEKRVALVVGNNDYRNVPKLQKAVNDARTMGDTLKQLGFTVMVAENQTPAGVQPDAAGVRQGGRARRHRVLLLCRPRL